MAIDREKDMVRRSGKRSYTSKQGQKPALLITGMCLLSPGAEDSIGTGWTNTDPHTQGQVADDRIQECR